MKRQSGYQPKWGIDWAQTVTKTVTSSIPGHLNISLPVIQVSFLCLDRILWVILVGKCRLSSFLSLLPLPTLLSPLFEVYNETNAKTDEPEENSEDRDATDPNYDDYDCESFCCPVRGFGLALSRKI
jgi:hypothetical protein